jgi:hypothetical protein
VGVLKHKVLARATGDAHVLAKRTAADRRRHAATLRAGGAVSNASQEADDYFIEDGLAQVAATNVVRLVSGAEKGDEQFVSDLLDKSIGQPDVNAVSPVTSYTALIAAAHRGDEKMVQVLLAAKADASRVIQTKNSKSKLTPLLAAVRSKQGYAAGVLRCLLKAKARVDDPSTSGNTPLAEAVMRRQTDWVKLLVAHKADANRPGKNKISPLQYAKKHAGRTIVSILTGGGGGGAAASVTDAEGSDCIR